MTLAVLLHETFNNVCRIEYVVSLFLFLASLIHPNFPSFIKIIATRSQCGIEMKAPLISGGL